MTVSVAVGEIWNDAYGSSRFSVVAVADGLVSLEEICGESKIKCSEDYLIGSFVKSSIQRGQRYKNDESGSFITIKDLVDVLPQPKWRAVWDSGTEHTLPEVDIKWGHTLCAPPRPPREGAKPLPKCPLCGTSGYAGFNMFDCFNYDCENHYVR